MLTASQSEAITVVRLSPKLVHKAVEETFKKNIKVLFLAIKLFLPQLFINTLLQDIYHGSEITSIKVGNNTKRAIFPGGEKNLTKDQEMSINMVVHVSADDENADEIRFNNVKS